MDNKRNMRILILSFPLLCLMLQSIPSYVRAEDIDAELNLNGVWSGMYIDNNVSDFASRNISFHITNYETQSGSFDGNAEIDNGDGGEFHFTGAINYETMDFSLLEDGATENPDDLSFKTFTGIVSDDFNRISGIINSDKYGIFSVERMPEEDESMQDEVNDIDVDESSDLENSAELVDTTDLENETESQISTELEESDEAAASQEDEQLVILQSELDEIRNENEMLQSELENTYEENKTLQSELDKIKSENEMLKNILEENEIEYD